jgi:serine/threonine protein kinase
VAASSNRERKKKPQPAPELEPGTMVADKYRVDKVLGEGGMGIVYAATHVALDQRVAIKALFPDALEDKQAIERFAREGRAAAKIQSDHVVRVYDVGVFDDGTPYMVMEYLEGADLMELLLENDSFPIDEATEYVLQACEGIAEAHKAGIIHRDLKPANIYVSRRADGAPNVKLLDFGISKFTIHPDDPLLDPSMTATATVMGSPGYMSPEQLKSARMVDERADIWALGTILYELVTSKPAFRGESMPQLCAMIASEDPPLPSTLRPDVPIALEHAILRCLEKKPERRFQNVGELARAIVDFAPERARGAVARIEGLLGTKPVSSRSFVDVPNSDRSPAPLAKVRVTGASSGTAQTVGVLSQPPRKRRGGAIFLGLLIVVIGAVGFGVYVGRTDPGGVLDATYPSSAPSQAASADLSDPLETASTPAPPPPSTSLSAAGVDVDAGALDDDGGDDDDDDDASDDGGDAHVAVAARPRSAAPTPRHRPKPRAHPYRGHPWNR